MRRFLLLCVAMCAMVATKAEELEGIPETKHITTEEFIEKVYDFKTNPDKWVFKGKKPCIFVFHATWCSPCRQQMPILDLISFDYGDKVDIYQVNVDLQYELAKYYKLQNIPTIYIAPKDGSEPEKLVRVVSYEEFSDKIENELLK